mgnify:CR=1 FL=1
MSLRQCVATGALFAAAAVSACAGRAPAPGPAAAPAPGGRPGLAPGVPAGTDLSTFDVVGLYRQMGLLASGFPMPFVGSIAFLGGRSADSTYALVTLSLANRSLGFTREGDRYAAAYSVTLEARRGDAPLARVTTTENVRVTSFKETGRTDESVIFEQLLLLPPGEADVSVTVRDEGTGRVGTALRTITVPRLTGLATLGTPVPFYQATLRPSLDTLPRLVPSPRSTVVFGRDSVVPVYLEA